jgi:hypothetical protein
MEMKRQEMVMREELRRMWTVAGGGRVLGGDWGCEGVGHVGG